MNGGLKHQKSGPYDPCAIFQILWKHMTATYVEKKHFIKATNNLHLQWTVNSWTQEIDQLQTNYSVLWTGSPDSLIKSDTKEWFVH